MADAHIAAEQAMYNFDNTSAYIKWMRDVTDAQNESGDLPAIVPTANFGYTWGNGPAWTSALFIVPSLLNQYTGDTQIIADMYASGKKYLEYLETQDYYKQNPSGWLGDWAFFKTSTPEVITNVAFHYHDAKLMAAFADKLGFLQDKQIFLDLANKIKAKFIQTYTNQDSNKLKIETQTALSCSIYYGTINVTQPVEKQLLEKIKANDNKLDFGLLGSKCFSSVLTAMGEADLVYEMITQPKLPSWGHWMQQGANTLWEHWDGTSSRNHIFLGDVSTWFWQNLAGIQTNQTQPGFKSIVIKPQIISQLQWVKAKTHQIHGEIIVQWRKVLTGLKVNISIPPNTTALVVLPMYSNSTLQTDGGRIKARNTQEVEIEIGSGKYEFFILNSKGSK
jgi:alpha-L-rhamnosidase